MSDWFAKLRLLPLTHVIIHHQPRTPRYDRAGSKLRYILRESALLGFRSLDPPSESSVEMAVWAPHPSGKGAGFYTCFRLYLDEGSPTIAQLFAFYDGTERSIALKSLSAALTYSRSNGFGGLDDYIT